MMQISKELAQQIADSAKSVVNCDINLISPKGIIIASTKPSRIDDFHEAGFQAAQTGEVNIVHEKNVSIGSNEGINYPIFFDDQVVIVIGITGIPAEVEKYGFLITKICEIFIKDNFQNSRIQNDQQRMDKLTTSLIYGYLDDLDYLIDLFHIDTNKKKYAVVLYAGKNPSSNELNRLEKQFMEDFGNRNGCIFSYIYPNEFVSVISEDYYTETKRILNRYVKKFGDRIRIGVGTPEYLTRVSVSYKFAKIAAHSIKDSATRLKYAEDLNIELLIDSLDYQVKINYSMKLLKTLNDEELQILTVYYEQDMSLKLTAEHLHIHKNTLQYKLEHIFEKTGLNPRVFRDAAALYTAVLIHNS